jgi:hypothetical protein
MKKKNGMDKKMNCRIKGCNIYIYIAVNLKVTCARHFEA